jgi:hypothetical protein
VLNCELPAAEVAAIPRLRELTVSAGSPVGLIPQLLALPSLQGLQALQVCSSLPGSALPLLPTLPALLTLKCWASDEPADWSWLPAMPALTDLDVTGMFFRFLPRPDVDDIGRCVQLRSLRLRYPSFEAGAFAGLCSTPALRRLRHLDLQHFRPRPRSRALTRNIPHSAHSRTWSRCASRLCSESTGCCRSWLMRPHCAH